MAERTCLRCGKKFESLSKGNRICPKCKGLKDVPMDVGVVGANEKLKKALKRRKVKPERWHGEFREFEDHGEAQDSN